MNNIAEISEKTINNLLKNKKELTPENYTKEFCILAKELKLSIKECEYFKKLLSNIDPKELEGKNPETIYDIIDILIHRIPAKNIQNMSKLLQTSMQPSISLSIGDDLQSFCVKIGDSPSLIFEESIQHEMEKYIQNRFNVDQQVLAKKTADIARLVSLMNKYLGDAIQSNNDGSSNVKSIKNEIELICPIKSTKEDLGKLQNKLVQAAITIESEMSTVNKNLKSGKNEVFLLEKKIQNLEKELKQSLENNTKDYLTKTLNRKSLEDELIKIENKFKRENKDYAVIFFDLDHFKDVNDVYGHEAGDIILKTFASLLLKLTRDTDTICRYGGEEFVAIIEYNNYEDLYKYIERIKNVVTRNKFKYKESKIVVTFSAGVEIRSNCKNTNDTMLNADRLLYDAKNSGRNKVIFWNKKVI